MKFVIVSISFDRLLLHHETKDLRQVNFIVLAVAEELVDVKLDRIKYVFVRNLQLLLRNRSLIRLFVQVNFILVFFYVHKAL